MSPQGIPVPPAKTLGGAIMGIITGILLIVVGVAIMVFGGIGWGAWLIIFAASVILWGFQSYRRLRLARTRNDQGKLHRKLQGWHSLTEKETRAVYAKPDSLRRNEWLTQGEQLMADKRYDDAEKAFQKAVEDDPQSAPAWFALGASQHRTGDLQTAIRSFQTGLKLAPQDEAAHTYLRQLLRLLDY